MYPFNSTFLTFMLVKKQDINSIAIGVLLASSREYPTFSTAFLDGIKLYFTVNGNSFNGKEAKLVIEEVGVGTETICIEKARKLIIEHKISFLTGLLEPRIGLELGSFLDHFQVPTLISTLGESFVSQNLMTNNVLFHTRGLWQHAYLEGLILGKEFKGENLTLITSLFDSGYDHLRAFRFGFESVCTAEVDLLITKAYSQEELQEDLRDKFGQDTSCVLILHPNLMNAFFRVFGDSVAILAVFPLSEENVLKYKSQFQTISEQPFAGQEMFESSFKEFFEDKPNLYHKLGYGNGRILHHACTQLESTNPGISNWESTLRDQDENMYVSAGDQLILKNAIYGEKWEIPDGLVSSLSSSKNAFSNPYLMF